MNKTDLTPFDKDYKRFIEAGTPWQEIFEGILSGDLPKKPLGVQIDEKEVTREWLKTLPGRVKPPKFKVRPLRELVTPHVKKCDKFNPQYNGVLVANGFSYWTDAYILFKVNDGIMEEFIHPDAVGSDTPKYEAIIPDRSDTMPEFPDLVDWYRKAIAAHEVNGILLEPDVALTYEEVTFSPVVLIKALKVALALHPEWEVKTGDAERPVLFESEGDTMMIMPVVKREREKIIEL